MWLVTYAHIVVFAFFHNNIAMADAQRQIANESAITFDLGSLFKVNQAELNELNRHEVPDADLCALLDNVSQNVHATHEKVDGFKP